MGFFMSTVVITGANGGIGLAFVEHYIKKDYDGPTHIGLLKYDERNTLEDFLI